MKSKNQTDNWLTVNRLAALTHSERRDVARWMDTESIPHKQSDGHTVYQRSAAISAIEAHQNPETSSSDQDIDPATGLSWSKARLREQVLQARAERERLVAVGGLIPVRVVEEAARQFGYQFDRLANDFHVFVGVQLTQEQRAALIRLADRTKRDFETYIRQWLQRQQELAAEQGQGLPTAPAAAPCPPGCMPLSEVQGAARLMVQALEALPGRVRGLSDVQARELQEQVTAIRTELADALEALAEKEAAS
jgi:hypothetical protein